MSVKRYEWKGHGMSLANHGIYVLLSDYTHLESERERLKGEVKQFEKAALGYRQDAINLERELNSSKASPKAVGVPTDPIREAEIREALDFINELHGRMEYSDYVRLHDLVSALLPEATAIVRAHRGDL